jgi:hypothetical protein
MDRRREHEENQRLERERVLRGELIGEEAFCDEWGLTLAPSGDLFTYEQVRDQPIEHVWTVVDTGDDGFGSWYASPGFHAVNCIGYVMTRKPWVDETLDALYYFDDDDHEELWALDDEPSP